MIDRAHIGRRLGGSDLLITRSRLRFFAEATGQTDPKYRDLDAARAAGHRDLPVPPTFLFGIDLEGPEPFGWLTDLGVDLRAVLHGEQYFEYDRMCYAGDELATETTLVDIYDKRGGELQFLVRETAVTDPDGERVAQLRSTTVVRTLSDA